MKKLKDTKLRIDAFRRLGTSAALQIPVYFEKLPPNIGGCLIRDGCIVISEETDYQTQLFIYCHELLHFILNHIKRGAGKDPEIWGIAIDHVVNHMLVAYCGLASEETVRQEGAILFSDLPNGPAELIYRSLQQAISEAREKGQSSFEFGGYEIQLLDAVYVNGKKAPVHTNPKDAPTIGAGALYEFENQMKSQGSLPAEIAREIERGYRPQVPWQRLIAAKILSFVGRKTITPTYTRIPYYQIASRIRLPDTYKKKFNLVSAFDTSGSISQQELSKFCTEYLSVEKLVTDHWVYIVDAAIHAVLHNPSYDELIANLKGGGGCVAPGALVLTSKGYVKIEDIKIGDQVFSHDGKLRKVLAVYRNDNDPRPCYKVKTLLGQEVILTYNHPLYVFKPSPCRYDRSSPCILGRNSKHCETCNNPSFGFIGWMTIDQIYKQKTRLGYYAVTPIITTGSGHGTYEDGYLTGFFIGDGWAGVQRRTVRLEFYVAKQDRPEKLLSILSRYGSVWSTYTRDTRRICLCNKQLGSRLRTIKYVSGKLLQLVVNESKEWCKGFLDGIIDADGYYIKKNPKLRRIQLSNWEYINAVMLACYKTGYLFSLREHHQPEAGFGSSHKKAWIVTLSDPTFRRSYTYTDGFYMYTKIQKIEPIENPGVTYNLKVQESESYLLQHVGSHNTSFQPVFEDVEKRKLKPNLLVYFTDTFGTFPRRPPTYPVIWIVVKTFQTFSVQVPFGTVYYID